MVRALDCRSRGRRFKFPSMCFGLKHVVNEHIVIMILCPVSSNCVTAVQESDQRSRKQTNPGASMAFEEIKKKGFMGRLCSRTRLQN